MTAVTTLKERLVRLSLEWLDPRRSLASAIGWMLTTLAVLGALAMSIWIGAIARERLEAQTGALYRQYAVQISNVLDNNLYNRLQWVKGTAQVFGSLATRQTPSERAAFIQQMQQTLPAIEWATFADAEGIVRVATGGGVEGQSVARAAWFVHGRDAAWVGEIGAEASGDAAGTRRATGEPSQLLDLAAPVRDAHGRLLGVVDIRLAWQWAQRLESILSVGLKSERPIQSLMLDANGTVLLGPAALLGRRLKVPGATRAGATGQFVARGDDGASYVVGYAVSDGVDDFPGLGWVVVVREHAESAFADVDAFTRRLFVTLVGLGLVAAAIGIWATNRLTRELARIARAADDIRFGKTTTLSVPAGQDEAARIGHSLRLLLDDLQRERAGLRALNVELDARVALRTRQIERMTEETRYAAVVRERLRMARDLHDTLAHSMMALLTEIRLLRKLADTNPGMLREEIVNAEAVALQGLQEARTAIAWLRLNNVRDIGLGSAIRQLLQRFEERRGVPAAFHSEIAVDALADERAGTLYRIVEEAMRNVERHANATRVDVTARLDGTAGAPVDDETRILTVNIRDDGVGFDVDAARPGHFGLPGMREQADLAGARLDIASTAGQGTSITITMPI